MKEEKGEDERRSARRARTRGKATGGRGGERDFDRGKVGALDREVSRGWHNRKLSMSLEPRERGTRSPTPATRSVLRSAELPRSSSRSNAVLYLLATLQRAKNLTNGPSPSATPCTRALMRARGVVAGARYGTNRYVSLSRYGGRGRRS